MLMRDKVNLCCKVAGNVCDSLYIPRSTLIDWLIYIGLEPYDPDPLRPYGPVLCASQFDNISGELRPFTKASDGLQT